jgi:hypothetical protein
VRRVRALIDIVPCPASPACLVRHGSIFRSYTLNMNLCWPRNGIDSARSANKQLEHIASNAATSTISSFLALPPELRDLVVDRLQHDKAALVACSLTCRAWSDHAQRRLLSTLYIRVQNAQHRRLFRKRLATLPRISRHVTAVRIHYEHRKRDAEEASSDIAWVAHLLDPRKIRQLTLEDMNCYESAAPMFTAYFPAVTTLVLDDVFFSSVSLIFAYITQCPYLERLLVPDSAHTENLDIRGPPPPDPKQARLRILQDGRVALDSSVSAPIPPFLESLRLQELHTGAMSYELLRYLKHTPCRSTVHRLTVQIYGQHVIDALATFLGYEDCTVRWLRINLSFDTEDDWGQSRVEVSLTCTFCSCTSPVQTDCTVPAICNRQIHTISIHTSAQRDTPVIDELLSSLDMPALERLHLVFDINNGDRGPFVSASQSVHGHGARDLLKLPSMQRIDITFYACPLWLSEMEVRGFTHVDSLALVTAARDRDLVRYRRCTVDETMPEVD